MSQIFDKIKVGANKRTTFDLSHDQITTSDFGYIIPICYRDMVPNDDFVVKPNLFVRLSPLAVPTYGRVKCRVHHFFVPYRILYPQWNKFITSDRTNFTAVPFFAASNLSSYVRQDSQFATGSTLKPRGYYTRLMSNLGVNPSIYAGTGTLSNSYNLSAFPFLAYYRIWMDWFMDPSIYDHPTYVKNFEDITYYGGSISPNEFLKTRRCCYKKDYFTTARVNPQAGSSPSMVGVDLASKDLNPGIQGSNALNVNNGKDVFVTGYSLNANSKIGQFTIEALRAANSLQRYLERNNFVGSKIVNRILAHFGVSPLPEREDMAEFIDGDSFPIQIGDVTSTYAGYVGDTYGLGLQAGKGVGAGSSKSVRYHAKEHGIFMSVMSILPDTSYYQGISRHWSKGLTGDPLDFFTPEFENLGYQAILNKELYAVANPTSYETYDPDGIWGYSPQYSEYKFQQSILAGDFLGSASNEPVTGAQMDAWHMFRKLDYDDDNPIALNSNFVELDNLNTDYDRIFQITDNTFDHFYFNINVDVKATRPMSGFTAPSLASNDEGDGNSINLPYGGTRL